MQSSFAKKSFIVLIPGAASSSSKVWIKGLNKVLGPIHQEEYYKYFGQQLVKNSIAYFVCPKEFDKDSRGLKSRAIDCAKYLYMIQTKEPGSTFHLVGHSMGGLIARELLAFKQIAQSIKSVTTISTPHIGTPLAGFAIRHHQNNSVMGKLLGKFDFNPKKKFYLKDLVMLKRGNPFINSLKKHSKTPIYSISNYKVNYINNMAMGITSEVLTNELQSYYPEFSYLNDGIVPTESMIFGTHLGTIRANHMESACILYSQKTQGCESVLSILIPHLNWLVK
jgi:hypothetical protein